MMNKLFHRTLSLLLLAALLCPTPALGAGGQPPLERSASYVLKSIESPQVGITGGEWAIIGVARSGVTADQAWYDAYLEHLTQTVARQKGMLSARKHTEYARVVLALTALGEDPRNVGGYDLLAPLKDMEKTAAQGINGPIFALLALDSGDYGAPAGLREGYLDRILSAQLGDGGWALTGTRADPDLTAQALQALAGHRRETERAVEQGLACLDKLWQDGALTTPEGYAQTIIALCTLGITPDRAMMEEFLSFQLPDGSFCHLKGGKADQMASEQGLCALAALAAREAGGGSLYRWAETKPAPQIGAILPPLAALIPAASGLSPFLGMALLSLSAR